MRPSLPKLAATIALSAAAFAAARGIPVYPSLAAAVEAFLAEGLASG